MTEGDQVPKTRVWRGPLPAGQRPRVEGAPLPARSPRCSREGGTGPGAASPSALSTEAKALDNEWKVPYLK